MKTKYEWGVEYPTNGKRPDLPDDVWVSCKIGGEWDYDNDYSDSVSYWNWPKTQAFKVLDPRYKPADTSYLNASTQSQSLTHSEEGLTHSEWWDYENAKFLENPSVGSSILCSCSNDGHGVVMDKFAIPVNVVAIHDGKIVVCRQDGKTYFAVSRSEIAPLDHATRKADLERKRVVDAAVSAAKDFDDARGVSEAIYDAGMLVLPPKKSDE